MPTAQTEKSVADLAREYFMSANSRDVDQMMEFWQPGGQAVISGGPTLTAPEGYHEYFGALFKAFPDLEFEIVDVIAEGEKAVVRWRARGTFSGEGKFEGLEPTGAKLEIEGIDIVTIRDGLVQGIFACVNYMDFARQVGALPPEGSAAEKAMLGANNAKTAALRALKNFRDSRS